MLIGAMTVALVATFLIIKLLKGFFNILCYLWSFPLRSKLKEAQISFLPETIPERVMAGSAFINAEQPPGQAEIFVDMNGTGLSRNGQCFRVDDYLLTAMHVLTGAETVHVKTKHATVKVGLDKILDLTNDVAALKLDQADMAKLGLKKLKLNDTLIDQRTYANVHGLGRQSGGHIWRSKEASGEVLYGGSTLAGFSGAPYMFGPGLVVGMHIAGGTNNIGIAAPYLDWYLKRKTTVKQEDSPDWIIDQAVKHMASIEPTSTPGEYLVEINNRIYDIDEGQRERIAAGKRKLNYRRPESLEQVLPPSELGPENLKGAPASAGAPGEPSKARVVVLKQRSTTQPEQASTSKESETSTTDGHSLTLAQLNDRLDAMYEYLVRITPHQPPKKSGKPKKALSKSTNPGQDPPAQ